MHEIHVSVVSTEDGSDGVAEFWSGGRMIAFTRYEENDLMLRIEPRHDGAPIMFGAHAMAAALAEATRLLATY